VRDVPEEDGIDLVIIAVPSRAVKEVSNVFEFVVYLMYIYLCTYHSHEHILRTILSSDISYPGYERLRRRIGQRSNHNLGWIQRNGRGRSQTRKGDYGYCPRWKHSYSWSKLLGSYGKYMF